MVAFLVPPAFIRPRTRAFFVGQAGTFSGDPSTITSASLGPAISKTAWAAISWSSNDNKTLDTVTIAGQSAIRAGRAINSAAVSNVEVWYANTSSATGNIVMDWSGGPVAGRVVTYYSDTNFATINVGQFSNVNVGTSFSTTVDTLDTGFIIAAARWDNASTGRTFTWSGATVVSSDNNGAFGESFAMVDFANVETARAVGGTLSNANDFRRLVAVAVR